MSPPPARRGGSLIAFLTMAFIVVGLAGILATYAAPLPLARALHEEAMIDDALAAGHAADIDAMAAALGKNDEARFGGAATAAANRAGDLPARAAALRAALRQTMTAEAEAAAWRLRFLIIVATIAAALFGAALMGAARR
ncbi:hypothetical protein [Acidibrevibacterium fodinaquatile]|uniref:hypothetical protein n=1 Tax=Acidibrevibacterium fodinaquatile TaxID=1969806 RepID=UPI000E0D5231|nr:hypothetical protein [Acidibrevibacterium fodinaquatile]